MGTDKFGWCLDGHCSDCLKTVGILVCGCSCHRKEEND